MLFRVFTLHPDIFSSFLSNSLIARGLEKNVLEVDLVNWREKFGLGNYKQVDDKPFGGGTGMVLQAEPIYNALKEYKAASELFKSPNKETEHKRILPNNAQFFEKVKNEQLLEVDSYLHGSDNTSQSKKPADIDSHLRENDNPVKKCTISLTPRGFPLNQQIVEWLAQDFEEINILSGRYEGFDARVSECVDLELSLGDYVLNGGEVATMSLIEAVSRLVPGFVTKTESINHDSFSSELNEYKEQEEFVVGKRNLKKIDIKTQVLKPKNVDKNLFDNEHWLKNILPKIEHPQYTRPETWQNWQVPNVLLSGNHKKIQNWRKNWS